MEGDSSRGSFDGDGCGWLVEGLGREMDKEERGLEVDGEGSGCCGEGEATGGTGEGEVRGELVEIGGSCSILTLKKRVTLWQINLLLSR